MVLGGVAIVAMMGISFASIRGCTRSDVATPTEATATDAVSEVTTVVNKTTEVVTTEKSKSNNKKGGSISGGVKKDHSTKESTSEEKSTDNNTKTPDTTEYTGNTEEPTTQRQADNDDGSSKKPPKKDDDGKKNPQPTTQSPTTEEATTREPVTEKPTTEEPVTTEHQHNWVAVKHEAKVKPAWREEVHTTETHLVCKKCGYDFTVHGEDGNIEAILDHSMDICGGAGYGDEDVPVVKYVDHPEEIIEAAYTSYKCSICGATK